MPSGQPHCHCSTVPRAGLTLESEMKEEKQAQSESHPHNKISLPAMQPDVTAFPQISCPPALRLPKHPAWGSVHEWRKGIWGMQHGFFSGGPRTMELSPTAVLERRGTVLKMAGTVWEHSWCPRIQHSTKSLSLLQLDTIKYTISLPTARITL